MRKPVFGVSDQVGHKPGCTTQKMTRALEFRIKEVEGLYHLYSENKGLDQLRGYRFSQDAAQIVLITEATYVIMMS